MAMTSRWALLSVTDKSGIVELARALTANGIGLLSTGGTAKTLRAAGLTVRDVAEHTGSPEIMDGRVKTLHPKIHGGILFDRGNPVHVAQAETHGIERIDFVVGNLYRFADEAVAQGLTAAAAIEHIDIGGPAMLRAAAKNWENITVLVDPRDYAEVQAALPGGGPAPELRLRLAIKVFTTVSEYDRMIAAHLDAQAIHSAGASKFPLALDVKLIKAVDLRYGENPHQSAALYRTSFDEKPMGFGAADILQGKELSYNNILDLDAATALVREFDDPAVAIIKHTNPCGVAALAGGDMATLFRRALSTDPKSAFGGIVAMNRPVDRAAAEAATSLFIECIAAPDFSAEALAVFKAKPAIRVLQAPFAAKSPDGKIKAAVTVRAVHGAWLVQDEDMSLRPPAEWQTVTTAKADAATLADLAFAMTVAKHVKSNAIVFANGGATVAIGAGQMSRIDSAEIAIAKAKQAGLSVEGSVLASDAFFPFRDTVDFAAAQKVRAVIQPGGSKRDQESVDAADEGKIAMVLTGERHFRH